MLEEQDYGRSESSGWEGSTLSSAYRWSSVYYRESTRAYLCLLLLMLLVAIFLGGAACGYVLGAAGCDSAAAGSGG